MPVDNLEMQTMNSVIGDTNKNQDEVTTPSHSFGVSLCSPTG